MQETSPCSLREKGNKFFEAQQFAAAAECYAEALDKIKADLDSSEDLQIPVRLNLAASLLRTGARIEEVEDLCSEVLALQPSNAKALFRRGCARQILAKRELHASDVYQARFGPVVLGNSRQSLMVAGVKDLLQAAKLEPQNRQVRLALKELQEALAEQLESGVPGVSSILGRPRQLSPVVPATPADKKQDGASSSQGPVGFVSEGEASLDPSDGLLCAIELPIPETENQWKRLRRDPTAWMAKGLRKQEVRYGRLEQKDRDAFDVAKQAEVNQWIRESAARRVQGHVAQDRLMAMRWVLTYKDSGAAKARIVIVGYQDPDLATLVSSSPTMSRRTRQLVYQQSTLRHWKTMKADVRAAFLQTAPTQISRCVFARPVPELAKAMQLQDGEVVQIAKACYGLVNAPAEWYRDVNKTLVGLGMTQLKTEPCAWRFVKWHGGVPKLVGLIAAHVDDFVITGDESDAEWINIVGRFHQSYRWSPWEVVDYNHCGVMIKEGHREVIMDQSKYCSQIDEIKFEARDEEQMATKEEVAQLRAALGALQWRAYSTAPQLMVQLSMLQSCVNKATVRTLKQANKLVREAYHGRFLHMKVTDLDGVSPEEVCFVAWADAAVGNRPDFGSTGGYIICATTPAMNAGETASVTPISWRSARLKRVARSSLAAETQAASEAEEELMLVRLQWREMLGYEVNLQKPGEEIRNVPGVLVTDAKSLYDVLHKEDLNSAAGGLQEKYSALELLSLCERVRDGGTTVRWVNSDAQVADALTKPTKPGALHQLLQSSRWRLSYDPSFTSAKRLKQRQ
ncbi:Gag-Pol polyprotein [Symbiodinium microadriaticum]|uniref:Gag-Pol polyprotein n=1 Tax=Symbiodinium microadriaticum TaxID=2951 RepID=A0A1Q9C137_SYMMI|nr:Gag-Pol polyprotein [Symbiodinium microadriaticum]